MCSVYCKIKQNKKISFVKITRHGSNSRSSNTRVVEQCTDRAQAVETPYRFLDIKGTIVYAKLFYSLHYVVV